MGSIKDMTTGLLDAYAESRPSKQAERLEAIKQEMGSLYLLHESNKVKRLPIKFSVLEKHCMRMMADRIEKWEFRL
jgi:hypothetical protein